MLVPHLWDKLICLKIIRIQLDGLERNREKQLLQKFKYKRN